MLEWIYHFLLTFPDFIHPYKPGILFMGHRQTEFSPGGRTGLMVRALDSGSGDPGSILGRSVCCFLEQESPKVLVIPRNRWLRLNMTEKLFTGTLNNNQKKKKKKNLAPDVKLQYVASHLGLFCLLTWISLKNEIKWKISNVITHLIRVGSPFGLFGFITERSAEEKES